MSVVVNMLKDALFSRPMDEKSLYQALKESVTVDGNQIYAGELLSRGAKHFPNKTAIIYKERFLTYKELFYRAVLFSKKLQSQGVKPGDNILICFENSVEFFVAYFAVWQIGAICVPLNTFLHKTEIEYIINDANPSCIVLSTQFKEKFSVIDINVPVLFGGDIDFETPLPTGEVEFDVIKLPKDSLCLLLYTSGTTGVPKGVMLSSKNIITNTLQCSARLGNMTRLTKLASGVFSSDERFFAALPLFHVFAQNVCVWFALMVGGAVIVVPKVDRRDILEGLKKRPTIFFGVPALYGLLCLMKTAPLESVKFFVSGGDAMPDKIRAAFSMVYGRKVCGGYGLTEASPVVSVCLDNSECRTEAVGHPLVGIDCQIRDDKGRMMETGVGTLWIKGDNIMLGYYNAEKETDSVLVDGWLNTGDLAKIDEQGHLAIVGRSKDLIIHKGFNIYPQEVENVLLSHPAVFQVAVIGKEDMTYGQVPVAYITFKSGQENAEGSLREFCRERLAVYKIPRKFVCLDDLPMNATGKIDKKLLGGSVS